MQRIQSNRDARQKLFEEMKGEDATGRSGEFRERARALGVTDEGWDAGVARAQGREPVAKPRAAAAAVPADPATMSPRERARDNSRTKGAEGAAADYFARNGGRPSERPSEGPPPRGTSPAPTQAAAPPVAQSGRNTMPPDYTPSRETPNAGRAYQEPPAFDPNRFPEPETPRQRSMPPDYVPSRDTAGVDAAPASTPAPVAQRAEPAPLPIGQALARDAAAVRGAVTQAGKTVGNTVGRVRRWKENLPFEVANAAISAADSVGRGASSALQSGQNMLAGAAKGIVDASTAVVPGETGRALRAENIGDRAGGAVMRAAGNQRAQRDAQIQAGTKGARRAVAAWRNPAPVVQDALARFRTQPSPAPRGSRVRNATATR